MKSINLVYIAGPYRSSHPDLGIQHVRKNIKLASDTGKALVALAAGSGIRVYPVIPHNNTALFDFDPKLKEIDDSVWLDGTSQLMTSCIAVVLVDPHAGATSSGTEAEVRRANSRGMPVFADVASYVRFVKQASEAPAVCDAMLEDVRSLWYLDAPLVLQATGFDHWRIYDGRDTISERFPFKAGKKYGPNE